jgi:hypothetical protein
VYAIVMLRRIFGPQREEVKKIKLHNEQLLNLYLSLWRPVDRL